jgi:pSer/pThr/pTyr-binding forkhead associated (FHA) protein
MRLVISVQGTTKPKLLVFIIETITTLFIGRLDPETGTSPDIDLQEYGSREQGVSRRHAAIIWRDDTLYLADLGSRNGTHLNEVRLFPNQPRVLQDGDTIRVGRIALQISFTKE